jgi:hypothetical protein
LTAKANAMAESFVDSFKTELIKDRVWQTHSQLELAILEWVAWFNDRRLHEALGDIPPVEFEAAHHAHQPAIPGDRSVTALAPNAPDSLDTARGWERWAREYPRWPSTATVVGYWGTRGWGVHSGATSDAYTHRRLDRRNVAGAIVGLGDGVEAKALTRRRWDCSAASCVTERPTGLRHSSRRELRHLAPEG